MEATARGEVFTDGKVLVLRRIVVRYRLEVAQRQRDTARRVLSIHADHCPVARTLRNCVVIETSMEGIEG